MSITPFSTGAIELPKIGSEEQLFDFIDQTCAGKYERAKIAVNEWWSSVVVSLLAADHFYGWDTEAGQQVGRSSAVPEQLKLKLASYGLDTEPKITKARAIGRACLRHRFDVGELLDEIGPTKAVIVGSGHASKSDQLLAASLDSGTTNKSIQNLSRELDNDPFIIQAQIDERRQHIADLKERRTGHDCHSREYTQLTDNISTTNKAIKKLETRLKQSGEMTAQSSIDVESQKEIIEDIEQNI